MEHPTVPPVPLCMCGYICIYLKLCDHIGHLGWEAMSGMGNERRVRKISSYSTYFSVV